MKYKQPGADVAHESQNVEQVAGVEAVDLALHAEPGEEHDEDGEHQQQAANPAALNEMAEAGKQPSGKRGDDRHGAGRGCGAFSGTRAGVVVFCTFAIR